MLDLSFCKPNLQQKYSDPCPRCIWQASASDGWASNAHAHMKDGYGTDQRTYIQGDLRSRMCMEDIYLHMLGISGGGKTRPSIAIWSCRGFVIEWGSMLAGVWDSDSRRGLELPRFYQHNFCFQLNFLQYIWNILQQVSQIFLFLWIVKQKLNTGFTMQISEPWTKRCAAWCV